MRPDPEPHRVGRLDGDALVCVHGCMSTHRKARQSPADSTVDRHFRRRIVVELTAAELPLLEAAEARHGSKLAALIAPLAAHDRIEELERARAEAERAAPA